MDINHSDEQPSPPSGSNADEAALELMKQLITLASGVLALGAAFVDKLPKSPKFFLAFLFLSWIALILSLIFGLKTISAIVKSRLESNDDWSRSPGRTFGRVSQFSFLIGIGLFATFAFLSLALPPPQDNEYKITISTNDPRIIESLKEWGPSKNEPQPSPVEKDDPAKRPTVGK